MSIRYEDLGVEASSLKPAPPASSRAQGRRSEANGTNGAVAASGAAPGQMPYPADRTLFLDGSAPADGRESGEMAQDGQVLQEQNVIQDVELAANTVEFDEATLADASVAGDSTAFETLYTHYFPKVRGFCLRKLGSPDLAEDIAQEAFARAFERINDFGGPRHFGGWVGTIAANLCTDFLRRKKNTPIPLEDVGNGPAYDEDPIRNIQQESTGKLVRLALEKLEPRHREALLLHEVKGMSCAAVGRQLGISEVAAESLLARARRRLRKEITAKAAPADLFGLGGLGLVPALVRAWRRAREGVGRGMSRVQQAAARSWETVNQNLVPSVDGAKALVVVMGAALAVEVASAAAPPVHRVNEQPAANSASVDGSTQADLGDASSGLDVNQPDLGANLKVDDSGVGLAGDKSIDAPQAPGMAGSGGVDAQYKVEAGADGAEATARVVVSSEDGTPLVDTGEQHVSTNP